MDIDEKERPANLLTGWFHRPHDRAAKLPSDLGEMRTVMAADRTLMAWIRTALSMLSFSFTIYKFFQTMQQQRGTLLPERLNHPDAARSVGLFLATLGTICVVLGTFEYWTTLKDLNRLDRFQLGRPTLLVAMILSLAGLAMITSIFANLL